MADTGGTESAQGSDASEVRTAGKKRRHPSSKGKDKRFSLCDTRHLESEDDEECSGGDGRGSKSESQGSDQMGILLQAINASKKAVDHQLEEFKDKFRQTSCQATERLEKRLKTGRPGLQAEMERVAIPLQRGSGQEAR